MKPNERMADAVRAEAMRPLPSCHWAVQTPGDMAKRLSLMEQAVMRLTKQVAELQRAQKQCAALFADEVKQSRKELGLKAA